MTPAQKDGGLNVMFIATDAHGGFGGIAQYNRDCLDALCTLDSIATIHVLPRVKPQPLETSLSHKLKYWVRGAGNVAFYAAHSIRYALSAGTIDLVYCAHINLIPVALAIAKLKRAPLVLAIYGTDVWKVSGRIPPRILEKHISALISISEITLGRFQAWCKIPHERTFIVPNAIQLSDYGSAPKNEALLDRLGLRNRTIVMTLGRMAMTERSKGFDRMIALLPQLVEKIPNVTYMMVGDGTERPLLEAQVADLGVQDHVLFAGRVPDEEKADFYRLADAYVMLSVGDGFGFVVVEALASGVPVVVSARDGTREAVRNGLLGTIVDPFDQKAVCQAILETLQRPRGVPAGLEYFTHERFRERLKNALSTVCPV